MLGWLIAAVFTAPIGTVRWNVIAFSAEQVQVNQVDVVEPLRGFEERLARSLRSARSRPAPTEPLRRRPLQAETVVVEHFKYAGHFSQLFFAWLNLTELLPVFRADFGPSVPGQSPKIGSGGAIHILAPGERGWPLSLWTCGSRASRSTIRSRESWFERRERSSASLLGL